MVGTFTATIEGWSERALRNIDLVFTQSVQDVFEDANTPTSQGGRMHVDTGFLRNSFTVSVKGSTSLTGGAFYALGIGPGGGQDMEIFGGWTASYAIHREFGARGQAPDFFMRGAAQKWPAIVAKNAAKVGVA